MKIIIFLFFIILSNNIFCQTLTSDREILIDPLSVQSLFIEEFYGNTKLATATGFIYEHNNSYYLITNWHVVSGRDPEKDTILDAYGRIPDKLGIWHNNKKLGSWTRRFENLYEVGIPRWIEHPRGREVDVIALPITNIDDSLQLYPFDIKLSETDMIPTVAMPVSIIVFPGGMSGPGKLAIWKTGHNIIILIRNLIIQ